MHFFPEPITDLVVASSVGDTMSASHEVLHIPVSLYTWTLSKRIPFKSCLRLLSVLQTLYNILLFIIRPTTAQY